MIIVPFQFSDGWLTQMLICWWDDGHMSDECACTQTMAYTDRRNGQGQKTRVFAHQSLFNHELDTNLLVYMYVKKWRDV